MPDRIELTSNDSIEVSEESVLDGEVVEFDLPTNPSESALRLSIPSSREEKERKGGSELTPVQLFLNSINVASIHSTMAFWISFIGVVRGW